MWCAYYTTKHAIPRLQRQSSEAIERQQARHEASITALVGEHQKDTKELVGQFRAELKEQREEYKLMTNSSIEAVREVAKAVDKLTQHVNTLSVPMKPIPAADHLKKSR